MRYFVFWIETDEPGEVVGGGYARAETYDAAFAEIGHSDAVLVELPDGTAWPPDASDAVSWENVKTVGEA